MMGYSDDGNINAGFYFSSVSIVSSMKSGISMTILNNSDLDSAALRLDYDVIEERERETRNK